MRSWNPALVIATLDDEARASEKHGPDQEAMGACFAEAMEGEGEARSWSIRQIFRLENGTLIFERSEREGD